MPDPIFANPRIAQVYDVLEADRTDLQAYASLVEERNADSVVDIGCGTGTLACILSAKNIRVIGADPAAASLDVARAKPDAYLVQWLECDAASLPPLHVEMALMTGNVAQVFLADRDWKNAVIACRTALTPGGTFAFEVRDPAREDWRDWIRDKTFETVHGPDETFDYWVDILATKGALVTFRQTFRFHGDGQELISDSTLRFRSRQEVENSLVAAGFRIEEIRDAPDRPGQEFVFVATA